MDRNTSYECTGPGNQVILGDCVLEYPPTLNDIPQEVSPLTRVRGKVLGSLEKAFHIPVSLSTSSWLNDVRFSQQLDDKLLAAPNEGSHVYLVTKPGRLLELSWKHWSIYTQGHFYQLSANVGGNILGQSNASGQHAAARTSLKVEDLSTQEKRQNLNERAAFVAYEMGRTHFSKNQVKTLGEWIIKQYEDYDLLRANCQLFVRSLLCRIIMTGLDHSVFVGSKSQFVEWDLSGRLDPHRTFNSRPDGYLLIKPCLGTFQSLYLGPFSLKALTLL